MESVLESLPVPIAHVSLEGVIEDGNAALAAAARVTPAELEGAVLAGPFEVPALGGAPGASPLAQRRHLTLRDGRRFVATFSTTFWEEESPPSLLVTFHAVAPCEAPASAAGELATGSLAESRFLRELLDVTLRNSPVGILVAQAPAGQPILMNQRLREILGDTSLIDQDLTARVRALRLTREDGSPYPEDELPLVRTLRDKRPHSASDIWLKRPDGVRIPVHARAAPLLGAGIDAAVLIVEDLSSSRERERLLRSAERMYRAIFEQANDAVFTATASWETVIEANPAAERLFGVRSGALVGRNALDLAAPDQGGGVSPRARLAEHLEVVRREGVARFPWRGQREGGRAVDLEMTLQALRLEGSPDLLLVHARDMTRQRQLEDGLRQSQKLEALGLLAGGIAHDFNNLLTGAIGFVELAQEHLPPGEPGRRPRKLLAEARRAADRATELTRRLLAFSRRSSTSLKPIDLNESVDRARPLLRQLCGETVRVEARLAREGCPILGDASELEQILVNLGVNARDAMTAGGTLLIETARCDLRDLDAGAGPGVVLSIADTGVGMTDSVKVRLFEPFFTTKERSCGTGLGLAVVHGIVQRHGGKIVVDASPGEGTRITIAFPLGTAPVARAEEAPGLGDGPIRGSGRVLVVDDDRMVLEVSSAMLESLGYTVTSVSSAARALECLAKGTFDLVVSDVVMPDTSGVELERRIRQERPGLPVLLVSGYAQESFARHGVDPACAPTLLAKPLTLESLGRAVRALLSGAASGCAAAPGPSAPVAVSR